MKILIVAGALALLAGTAAAMPRDPGFDCFAATLSSGEKAVCASDDLGWYDRQVGKLLTAAQAAPGADAAALKTEQDAFVATRNACGEKDFACVRKAYQDRVTALVAAAGNAEIAFTEYTAKTGSVSLLSLPGKSAAIRITALNAENHSCTFESDGTAMGDGGAIAYADDKPVGGKTCKIAITPSGDGLAVATTDCEQYCGVGVTMDGSFTKGTP